jgi:hypothetical protein
LSLLGPNALLSTLFSNTFILRSSLNVSDQASHPYKTTGKIIVLYMLSFKFLDSRGRHYRGLTATPVQPQSLYNITADGKMVVNFALVRIRKASTLPF